MRLCEVNETGYLVAVHGAVLHLPRQLEHAVVAHRVEGVDYGEGELALGHVVAGGLADVGGVVIVEDVVPDLEDYAQCLAELLCLPHPVFGHSGRYCADCAAGFEEGCGLAADYLIIRFLRYFAVGYARQLQYLAVRQRAAKLGKIPYDDLVVRHRDVQQGGGQDVVAHEHGHLIVVHGVDRSLPPALAALVHHVVVNERCRVQQLQTHRRVQRRVVNPAIVLCHKHDEHRPHALAGAVADACENLLLQLSVMRKR